MAPSNRKSLNRCLLLPDPVKQGTCVQALTVYICACAHVLEVLALADAALHMAALWQRDITKPSNGLLCTAAPCLAGVDARARGSTWPAPYLNGALSQSSGPWIHWMRAQATVEGYLCNVVPRIKADVESDEPGQHASKA